MNPDGLIMQPDYYRIATAKMFKSGLSDIAVQVVSQAHPKVFHIVGLSTPSHLFAMSGALSRIYQRPTGMMISCGCSGTGGIEADGCVDDNRCGSGRGILHYQP